MLHVKFNSSDPLFHRRTEFFPNSLDAQATPQSIHRLEPPVDVTVAICTWNRARLLDATLAQMCTLRIPAGLEWELLVVDNNCTDATPAVVDRYVGQLPIRRIVETQQGTSYAKNAALALATGELLVWTDDDVLVHEEWLAAYVAAAERWPNAGYFGGLITPWFENPPPPWYQDHGTELASVMVLRDLGPTEREIGPSEPPFGANMAFRRAAVAGRSFDVNIGPHADDRICGEETKFCRELAEDGVQGVWIPSAKVQHYVVDERMTVGYIRKYWTGVGRTDARLERGSGDDSPRWVYRSLVAAHARYLWQRATNHADWVKSLMEASRLRGVLIEYRARTNGHS